jgi:predicted RNA binding protein YcfA (HicA-like mRNA interferase family)
VGSREVIRLLLDAGWVLNRVNGSHHIFKHSLHPELGSVVVPHPRKDLPQGTLNSILRKAGLK